jgi:S1-C subfamily serine protease
MPANQDHRVSPVLRTAAVLVCVLWLVGGLALIGWWFWPGRSSTGLDPNAQPRPVTARGELSELEQTNIGIYKGSAPSVVHVTKLAAVSGGLLNLNVQQIPKGTGSGFVWDQDGHIVTNNHVVEGADATHVTLADHSTYTARQVWTDPDEDIAVIKIDAPKSKLHPILIGTSHDLQVGQSAYAIGNPFGLDQSMTVGIISALNREMEAANGRPIRGVIQTSAAINPGNSGGPLLDSAGRLIGMNTAIISPSGAFAGIGFAIPVDEINAVVPQLIQNGRIVRPRLGVQIAADQLAKRLGVDEGVLVLKVVPDSPAAAAGLQGTQRDDAGHIRLGDVIVTLGGHPVKQAADLYSALDRSKVGETITVTILRKGKRQDVQATLQAR